MRIRSFQLSPGVAPFALATDSSCDRACLTSLADRHRAALAAHDRANAPLARDVRIVGNRQRIRSPTRSEAP